MRLLLRELGLGANSFLPDGDEPGAHLGGHRGAGLDEIEQVLPFGFQVAKCLGQVFMHQPRALLLVAERGFQYLAHTGGEAPRQPQRHMMLQHCRFRILDPHVGGTTRPVLPRRAHEIPVLAAVPLCSGEKQRDSIPRSWQRPHHRVLLR